MASTYRDFIRDETRAPAIVAHRGAWHDAPENSMAAIERAIELGYEIVEIDIQESLDGTLFVSHDTTLDRMTETSAVAESLTIADLCGTRLKARDGGDTAVLTDECIPTLEAVLTASKGRVFFDLDVKDPRHLPATASLVKKLGMANEVNLKRVVQTAEDRDDLCALEAAFGVMVKPMTRFLANDADALLSLMRDLSPVMIESEFDRLDTLADRYNTLRLAGIAIWVNTLDPVACGFYSDTNALDDPEHVWGTLIDAGVSIIQTDEPEALRDFLDLKKAVA